MNLGAIITIIIVVAWVVRGLASVMGNQEGGEKKRPARSLEDWDDLQAKRREAMSEQREGLQELRAQSGTQNPAQMTMAERIELARQRARQRARQQAGLQGQGDDRAEALRRARAQAERQAQQQREQAQQLAQRERAARQQQANRERERIQQQRRRQAEQADIEAQQQRQRRSKQQPRTQSRPALITGSQRENVVAQSVKRIHKGHEHTGPVVEKQASRSKSGLGTPAIGKLDRSALRHAFIMKELLDKPVALRNPQADLPW